MQKTGSMGQSIMPFPEDSATDADERASLADGQWVVAGHAHGQFAEGRLVLEVRFLQFPEEGGKGRELPYDLPVVVGVGSHAHQPGYLHMG